MSVWVFSPKKSAFSPLEFDATPIDLVRTTGELTVQNGVESIILDGGNVRIDETRAGWLSGDAGRLEQDYVVFDGWVLDRLRNQTADLVLVFANGKLIYAAAPTVPNLGAEQDAKLKGNNRAGFVISLPSDQVFNPDGSKRIVRIFALTEDRVALEIYYTDAFPFRAGTP
jgi:hypothetical protein